MNTPTRRVVFLFLVAILLVTSCAPSRTATPKGVPEDLSKVWEAYKELKKSYVHKEALDADKLADAAVRGMVESLNDPFTAYFDSPQYQIRVDSFDGTFTGIGATVSDRDGHIVIVSTVSGSPAEKAGIKPGDLLQRVGDQPMEGKTVEQAVLLIRGAKNTQVTITISSNGKESTLALTRSTIVYPTVNVEKIGTIGVIRLSQFVDRTNGELAAALKDLKQQGVRGAVLDLRGNPGGLLTSVVDVASQFLDKGLVLYEVDSNDKRTDFSVKGGGLYTSGPLVVLVNRGSASGSEVVAGAIQSYGRAQIVGTQTFGKGVVNIPVRLSDGSGLYLSTATWYTPSGQVIGNVGLTPDVVVPRTTDDIHARIDPQMDRAVAILNAAIQEPA